MRPVCPVWCGWVGMLLRESEWLQSVWAPIQVCLLWDMLLWETAMIAHTSQLLANWWNASVLWNLGRAVTIFALSRQ